MSCGPSVWRNASGAAPRGGAGDEWIVEAALWVENVIHGVGELTPFLFAEAEFGEAFGGDGEIAALVVFARLNDAGRDQAAFFHRREQGVQPSKGELEIVVRSRG